ncbi:MAG: plastocyanin/azurin family copper-binding protein [Patescibacteria group bacterium]
MKKSYLIVGLVIVVLVGGVLWSNSKNEALAPVDTNSQVQNVQPSAATENTVMVVSTDAGYSPNNVKIKVGDTVVFKNEDARPVWTASAMHPSHKVYPGSDIAKCDTAEQSTIFDACTGIASGASWSFKFDAVGTWKYHDHLNPSHYGSITVE